MVSHKYTEIFKLKAMLDEAGIPYGYRNRSWTLAEHYQVGYPELPPSEAVVCSVIERDCTYGHENDLLEIMGLLTEDEAGCDSVCGDLSADEVFARIKSDWIKRKNEGGL